MAGHAGRLPAIAALDWPADPRPPEHLAMMSRPLLAAALGLALFAPFAGAQTAPTDDSLYRELGGREAIQRFTNDFYDRMLLDARIAHHFDGINMKYLKQTLSDYFCRTAGGPCVYDGVSMRDAHAHLGLRKSDFNALVEDLQLAMDAAQVPFAVQNRFLARMAFFHRDIVTK
jgi:hemoglobin